MQNKTNNSSKPTAEQLNDDLNLVHLGQKDLPVSMEEAFDLVEKSDTSKMVELTSTYFNFETKGDYVFIFEGMTTATLAQKDETGRMVNKKVEAVSLRNKAGETLINANAVLVNSCKKITSLPCFIKVQYLGDEKAQGGGTYKNLKVVTYPGAVGATGAIPNNTTASPVVTSEKKTSDLPF
jgi:hypothetical protein